jgi:hypothetical protein
LSYSGQYRRAGTGTFPFRLILLGAKAFGLG